MILPKPIAGEKNQYFKSEDIVVGYSEIEGIGVIATNNIASGQLIERCPMVRLDWRSNYVHDPQLRKYCYKEGNCGCSAETNPDKEYNTHGGVFWMVLGYGMIYNHQDSPNTEWNFYYDSSIVDVVATQDIPKGSEVYVTYESNYFTNRKNISLSEVKEMNKMSNDLEHIEDDSEFMNKVKSLIDSPDVPKIPESEDIIPEVEESDEDFLARMQEITKNSP